MQILNQIQLNNLSALEAIIRRSNLSEEIRRNLTQQLLQLQLDIRDGKIDLTKDHEVPLTLYGPPWETEYISDSIKIFFYWIYFIIFVIGISGNILVFYVFTSNKSMHTVTNMFITNLAISDIFLCLFAVPFTPLYLLTFKEWVFGTPLCHLVPYVQGMSVYISAFTLMSIAIDRFFVIIYPFKPRMKMRVCALIILSVWLAAALLTLPYGYFVQTIESPYSSDVSYCDEVWPSETSRRTFGITTSMLQFVIPVVIISYCYIQVCGKLSNKTRTIPGVKSARKEELERERTSRTNRMLISMVIVFGISWLPLNCYNLVLDFHIQAARWNYSRALFLLAHAIAMSSTCYNPLLYAWLNENFRKEFKSVLPCWRSQLITTNSSRRDNSSCRVASKWNEHNTSKSGPRETVAEHRFTEQIDNLNSIDQIDDINSPDDHNANHNDPENTSQARSREKQTTVRYLPDSNSIVMQIGEDKSNTVVV